MSGVMLCLCYENLNTREEMIILSKIRTKILYKLRQRNIERREYLFVLLAQMNSRPEKVISPDGTKDGIYLSLKNLFE